MELTREKVMAMEVDELSLAVAENVFNAKICGRNDDPEAKLLIGEIESGVWKPLKGRWQTANWRNSDEKAWLDCPRYAEDISAAWEVVDKLKREWSISILNWGGDDPYEVIFGYQEGDCRSASQSLPEAICRAALLTTIKEDNP